MPVPYRTLAFFVYRFTNRFEPFWALSLAVFLFFYKIVYRTALKTQKLTVFRSNIYPANSTVKNTKIYRFSLEKRDPYRFEAFRYLCFKNQRGPYRTKKLGILERYG